MADQTQAEEQVEGQSQPSPMPSEEQKVNEPSSVEENAQETEVQESTDDDVSLSSDVSDRTATQFDKIKEMLAEERSKREQLEQVVSYQTQQPKVEEPTPLYDPITGYVDVTGLENLQKGMSKAEKQAANAERKLESYIQQQQEEEAFQAHPELKPGKGHDKGLHNLTRAIITDSVMNPNDYGGRELTFKQAADLAKKQSGKVIDQVRKEAATEAVEQLTPKEQASLEATGRSDRRADTRDYGELIDRTRRNDLGAIMERLKNISPVAGG